MRGLLLGLSRLPPLLLLVLCLVLFGLTGNKLWRMAQVRGWVKGAEAVSARVVAKAEDRPRITLATRDGTIERDVPEALWRRVATGDELEVRYLPGDRTPYLPDGAYAAPGQFVLDGVLFVLWAAGVAFYGRRHVQRRAMKQARR